MVEILCSLFTSVCVSENIQKAVFTIVKVLLSMCKPVCISGKILTVVKNLFFWSIQAFFTIVEGVWKQVLLLWKSCESSVQLFECQRGPWKQFSHCWALVKLVHASLSVRKHPECSFSDCRGSVKLMTTSLRVRKDTESRFDHCGCLVNLVHAVLSVRNGSESSFSIVQVFYVCLSLTRDLESCFYYCEGPVKVVQSIFGVSHHCLVVVLWTSGSQVWVSGNMLKVVFTTVLILWSLFTAVWVSGCTDEAFLYKSFIGPRRWWEMLSDSPLILKLACTSFTGLLVVKTAFKIYRNPQTGVHELHSTSTVRMFLCQEVGFTTVEQDIAAWSQTKSWLQI